MLFRQAALTLCVALLSACAPSHRYASSEATYLRFELETAAYPDSTARWYECFALEDAEYRQLCLSRTPGVRVAQGPGLLCSGEPAPTELCRAFPLFVPETNDDGAVDDDNAGAAIADAFGRLLVGILVAAVESDDDDDDDSAKEEDDDDEARSVRAPARPTPRLERRAPDERRRAHQRGGRPSQR